MDNLLNIIIFIFWFKIWTSDEDRDVFFNPHLSIFSRSSKSIIDFLRPVFFTTPPKLIAFISILFLFLFRGLLFRNAEASGNNAWTLILGFDVSSVNASIISYVFFSFISFAIFIFKLWGISLIYIYTPGTSSNNHASNTIFYLSRPFTDVKIKLRPLLFILYGMSLAFLLNISGINSSNLTLLSKIPLMPFLLKLSISALAGLVGVLNVIISIMILLIIGSIVSMFTASYNLASFCRDWIDFLLGPLRKYPIKIGMFDLTPIIFFLIVEKVIYPILMAILYSSYQKF